MNIASKVFCRIFQKCFHIAIPILPYRTPKILDSVALVPGEFMSRGVSKILIVTDSFIGQSHGMELLKEALTQQKVDFVIFDKTRPNPTVSDVEEARRLYIDNGCEGIVGFGGGS
ncbi:MAG: iron-containing alcohol dehydrogenase, partial [Clostridia bacterium]|nr:iron-containing alcohol dehydrogenase [Clostridia bacterium]